MSRAEFGMGEARWREGLLIDVFWHAPAVDRLRDWGYSPIGRHARSKEM
jgi:hypothetical protein